MAPEPAAKKKKAGGRHLDLSPLYIVVPLLGPQGKNMSRLQGLSYHTGDSKGLLHAVLWEVVLDLLDFCQPSEDMFEAQTAWLIHEATPVRQSSQWISWWEQFRSREN